MKFELTEEQYNLITEAISQKCGPASEHGEWSKFNNLMQELTMQRRLQK